ncbi:MAG TPA: ABC transporter substrate-binding protein [Cyanobacteria bacterium UBA8803]|nr:ABC transporter substrate-binding protein [Cyanobacteria bacterium UBA9273]HBL61269.1 ABC transporter substrate-binding protein [Cyanobacteria bacterium UBA8803]
MRNSRIGNHLLPKLQEFLQQFAETRIFKLLAGRRIWIWILLALSQISFLVFLSITWPPVILKLRVSEVDIPYWSSSIANFNKNHRGIKIRLIPEANTRGNFTEDLQRFYDIKFRDEDPDDLIYMDIIWVRKFTKKGWLLNLSDKISPADLAEFSQADINTGLAPGGQLYRIPLRSDIGMFYYRKDLLDQARYKPPETFEQLIKISKALQHNTGVKWGYLWQGREYEGLSAMFVEVLQGHGGFWIQPDTLKVGLDRPEAIAAVKFLLRTIDENISPHKGRDSVLFYSEQESLDAFAKGDALFLRGWPDMWNKVNAIPLLRGNVGVQPMRMHVPGSKGGGCNGSWGLGIAKKSKHPQAAWEAIKYLTSPEAQRQLILDTGFLPIRKSLFEDGSILKKYPYFKELAKAVEASVLRPAIPQYGEASEILQRYLHLALRKQLSPKEAMAEAAIETRQLLGRH